VEGPYPIRRTCRDPYGERDPVFPSQWELNRDGYRVFYRIANPRESNRRLLFDFLRQIFKDEDRLDQDTKRLREAIASGSCTVSEWKPYSAIEKGKLHRTGA
jgi:hypothetical protein